MGVHGQEPEDRLYTVEEFEQLPDDGYYHDELVRGRLVREPPPGVEHGRVLINLAVELGRFVRVRKLGLLIAESGYVLGPATVRAPDISFISRARIHPEGLSEGYSRLPPDLAIEIVSPSNRAADVQAKIEEYFDAGVRQVWVVSPRTRQVALHVSRTEVRILGEGETLDGGDVVPGFRLPLADVFAD